MSFDDKSVTDKLVGNGLSLASCGDGLKCLKRELAVQHTGACDETLRGSKGKGYRGCQTKTRGGYTCQRWDVQSPHGHATWNTPQTNPNDGLKNNNYCRNHDGEPTIWCYTTNSKKRWDFCDPRVDNGIELTNQQSMQMSAIMTWIRVHDNTANGNIWYAREQDSKYEKYFGINRARQVTAKYYGEHLTTREALTVGNRHHVATVLNKENGFALYVDGANKFSKSIVQNINIEYPTVSPTVNVLDMKAEYDDFRIYVGVLTDKHV